MDIDIDVQIIIKKPRPQVSTYAMDPQNDKSWIEKLEHVSILSGTPLSEGSHVERMTTLMGQQIEYVMEIDHLKRHHVLEMHSIEGPFPLRVTYIFEEAESDTIVHIRVQANPGGIYRFASTMISSALEQNIYQDLVTLKRILEDAPVEP